MNNPGELVRIVPVDPDKDTDLQGNTGQFKWTTASTKQIVVLKGITVAAVINSIGSRIPNGSHVRAIYDAVAKPPADGDEPEDTERITCEEDLRYFLEVTRRVYKPIRFQLQLNKTGSHSETPSLDGHQYFKKDEFPATIPKEPYNPVTFDCDNKLYLINFGKKKAKAWPRSDHGYEHEKAKCRSRINCLTIHLKELKTHHCTFIGPRQSEIVDSDNESHFIYVRWLNSQSRRAYIRAPAVAKKAGDSIGVNFRDEKQAQAKAICKFGPRQKWDFNLWTQEPHKLTPSHSTGDSDNGTGNDSEDASDASGLNVDVSDVESSGV